ncbi:MAG: hypothetical protein ACM3SS_10280 [Rhodospirillaceae bacterium]
MKLAIDSSFCWGMRRERIQTIRFSTVYIDANIIIEIVTLVAMYCLTNFFDNVFDRDTDFPAIAPAGSI